MAPSVSAFGWPARELHAMELTPWSSDTPPHGPAVGSTEAQGFLVGVGIGVGSTVGLGTGVGVGLAVGLAVGGDVSIGLADMAAGGVDVEKAVGLAGPMVPGAGASFGR